MSMNRILVCVPYPVWLPYTISPSLSPALLYWLVDGPGDSIFVKSAGVFIVGFGVSFAHFQLLPVTHKCLVLYVHKFLVYGMLPYFTVCLVSLFGSLLSMSVSHVYRKHGFGSENRRAMRAIEPIARALKVVRGHVTLEVTLLIKTYLKSSHKPNMLQQWRTAGSGLNN